MNPTRCPFCEEAHPTEEPISLEEIRVLSDADLTTAIAARRSTLLLMELEGVKRRLIRQAVAERSGAPVGYVLVEGVDIEYSHTAPIVEMVL